MGASSTDYSSNYAPNINQSQKLDIKSGLQSEDLSAIFKQFQQIFSSGLDSQRKELSALRDENKSIRRDMKDYHSDSERNRLSEKRMDTDYSLRRGDQNLRYESQKDDYSVRNRRLDVDSEQNQMRYGGQKLKMS